MWFITLIFTFVPTGTVFPACQYEDSLNCFWNASVQGNGEGQSFVNFFDVIIPLDN